eukprot:IDg3734t1
MERVVMLMKLQLKSSYQRSRKKFSQYIMKDVFNADEHGHFYQLAPTPTIAGGPMPGRKKQKSRLTYLACCNANSSEKFPLMVIGKAKKPRAFRGKTGQELGFDYYNNKKAWMTSVLFFDWLKRFDSYIGKTPGRKAALLLDNASVHGNTQTIPDLHHTEFSSEDIYKVDILLSMKWMKEIWNELDGAIISNCWKHTRILSNDEDERSIDEGDDGGACNAIDMDRLSLLELINEVLPQRVQISIDELINPCGEEDCVAVINDQELVTQVVHDLHEDPSCAEEEEELPDEVAMEAREALYVLGKA